MSKVKKVFLIIGVSILGLLAVALATFYIIDPVATLAFLNGFWDLINEPLPVAGVSILIIFGFLFNFISKTSWGKQAILTLKTRATEVETFVKEAVTNTTTEIENLKQELTDKQEQIDYLKSIIAQICMAIPNKKVNEIGELLNEKEETTDNQTEDN